MPETLHAIRPGHPDETYDLTYSPDDGGWYLQRWSDDATSPTYATREDALIAARAEEKRPGSITWTA